MLLDTVQNEMKDIVETSDFLSDLMVPLKAVKAADSVYDMLEKQMQARDTLMKTQEKANAL